LNHRRRKVKQLFRHQQLLKLAKLSKINISLISLILVTTSCQTSTPQGDDNSKASNSQNVSLSIAISYLDAGRPDKAMHELEGVLSEKPNYLEALNLMGLAQLALSNPKKAVSYLEKAWKIDPKAAVGVNLSSAYLEVGRNTNAEKIIKQILSRKEATPYKHKERLYHNYGLVADRTNRAVLAEKMFKRAVEENPMFYMSHLQLAYIYKEKKKPDLALKQLESARFACPSCFEPLKEIVKINIEKGEVNLARQLIHEYKVTEGISVVDRKKVSDLENQISKTAQK
jgi:Tfp pilus assembly protein PilF